MLSHLSRSSLTRSIRPSSSISSSVVLLPSHRRSNSTTPSTPSPPSPTSTSWTDALKAALPSFSAPISPTAPLKHAIPDPLKLVKKELNLLRSNVAHLLGSGHPSLDTVAKYYFQAEGKHIRPTIVLLMSQATNGLGGAKWDELKTRGEEEVNRALSQRDDVLNDYNPGMPESTKSFNSIFIPGGPSTTPSKSASKLASSPTPSSSPSPPSSPSTTPSSPSSPPTLTPTPTLLPTQRRLAEICEMIHVASLLHDDVIDTSPLRRGIPSSPALFGNKLSILSGDFLLGRCCAGLARLGSNEVVELMATAIANLVEGEVAQLKATTNPEREPNQDGFDRYMQKTYLKTASLMAKSARCAVILGGCEDEGIKDVAYAYGRNLGIAFQLVDDLLDFTPTPSLTLGKPSSGFDMSLGLATAPLLYAWESNPSLGPLILRRFDQPGDVEAARDLVLQSDGMERTRKLARAYAEAARDLVRERLPESEAREGLESLAIGVLERCK